MNRIVLSLALTLAGIFVGAATASAGDGQASIQVAHLAPFAVGDGTAVDIQLNGETALAGVVYGESTGYIALPPGSYTIEVFPVGATDPAITGSAELVADTFYSVIAIGDGVNQPLGLSVQVDDNTPPDAGELRIRIGHLAPFASGSAVNTDVRLQDNTPLLENITFTDISDYLALPAATYDLVVTAPGGSPALIDPLPADLAAGQVLSAYATGDGANQDLGVFVLPAGAPGFFLPLGVIGPPPPPPPTPAQAVPGVASLGLATLLLLMLGIGILALRPR